MPAAEPQGARRPALLAALLASTIVLTGCSTAQSVGAKIASWLPDFGRKPALTDPVPPPARDAAPAPTMALATTAAANMGPSPATDAMNLAVPQEQPRPPLAGGAAAPIMAAGMAAGTAPAPAAPAPAQTAMAAVPATPPAAMPAAPVVVAAPGPAAAPAARANLLAAEAADDNTVLGRMRRVEAGLAQMQTDFNQLKPSIERLVAIEDDLDELVAQLFTVITGQGGQAPAQQQATNTAPATGARPAATPAPAAGGAPISLLPGQAAPRQPAAAPTPTAPAPAATTRPATQTAAATPATVPAPVAQTGAFALHLASYRKVETARDGWAELARELPTPLNGLRPGTAVFDKEREGRYYRLMAGPIASRGDAEARCRVIQQAGDYCAVMPYAGTTPLN